jgi:hypothetical protein
MPRGKISGNVFGLLGLKGVGVDKVIVHRNRTNVISVELGIDITGDTITSEIRVHPEHTSVLLATWVVAVVNAVTGNITLTLDDLITGQIEVDKGYMDIKRVSGGEPVPLFDRPVEVEFRGTVTA